MMIMTIFVRKYLYGLNHHIVEIRGDVTMWDGRTNDDKQVKIELLSRWKLEDSSDVNPKKIPPQNNS